LCLYIFQIRTPEFPLGVKVSYRLYAEDWVYLIKHVDEIPFKSEFEDKDKVPYIPVKVEIKWQPEPCKNFPSGY